MKSIIKTAKTIEEAIELGLRELNLSREDVEIEIIQEPTKGIFGIFGGNDAIVKVKENKKMTIDFHDIFEDTDLSQDTNVSETFENNFEETEDVLEDIEEDEEILFEEMEEESISLQNNEDVVEEKEFEVENSIETENSNEETVNIETQELDNESSEEYDSQEESFEEDLEYEEDTEAFETIESDESTLINTRDLEFLGIDQIVTDEDDIKTVAEKIRKNLENLLVKMHINTKVSYTVERENVIELNLSDISENDTSIVIGAKGETLNAIQYVLSLITNKNIQNYYRITVNVADYRDRRKKAIESNAKKVAFKVLKTKKSIALKPMNSYERRIVHFSLQNYKNIETVSTGKFPNRKVIVKYSGQ